MPKFEQTSCSQCGCDLGPGDSGVSHCEDHAPKSDRFLRAYYHEFKPTGDDRIDAILEAIALAGKAYHNTSDWNDAEEYGEDGYWAFIQRRADEAARSIRRTGEAA
jgi:hypothetical protein